VRGQINPLVGSASSAIHREEGNSLSVFAIKYLEAASIVRGEIVRKETYLTSFVPTPLKARSGYLAIDI
jgi:hypothetical protein